MLEAIELWASNAAYKHLTKGHHLNNEVVAKDLKVLAELAKRLKNDDYNDPWFLPDYESEHFSVPIEGSDLIELKTKNYKVVYNNPERKETIDSTQETVYKIIKLKGKQRTTKLFITTQNEKKLLTAHKKQFIKSSS
jgi:hypothetical protein